MIRLLLASYAYPPSVGGVERHSQQLARALRARGHQVRVVTAAMNGAPAHEVDPAGIEIDRVDAGTGSRWQRMATFVSAMTAHVIRVRNEIDVIHVQQALYPAAALTVVGQALRKPVVVRNSGSGTHGAVQLMSRLPLGSVALWTIGRFAKTVALSDEMTGEMRVAGFRNVVQIPNGVVLPDARISKAAARRELGIPETARVALYVGRLDREKGTALLARAWPLVKLPEALLVVAGDGPERHLLETLGPTVRLDGMVPEVAAYYVAADVFVLPSESEGISNALLEAMAAGRPAVATAVGGNRAVIASADVGLLAPPGDAEAFAAAIAGLLGSPAEAERIGRSARAHVASSWSFDAMVGAYEALYRRIIDEG